MFLVKTIARWVALGPACIVSAFAGHFVLWFLMGGILSRSHSEWSAWGWLTGGNLAAIFSEGAGGAAFSFVPVFVAAFVAPAHKRNAAFIVAIVAWTFSTVALVFALLTRQWWSAYGCVAQMYGAVVGWKYARELPVAVPEGPRAAISW